MSRSGLARQVERIDACEPRCLECGSLGVLTSGEKVYPGRPDLRAKWFYVCACGAKVGCHPGTTLPLGKPAGPETQGWRSQAHRVFDPLWKRPGKNRRAAYKWLAAELGVPRAECHISWFDAATCKRVVDLCRAIGRRS